MKLHRANRSGILLNAALAALICCRPMAGAVAAEIGNPRARIDVRVVDSVTRAPVNAAEVYLRGTGDEGLRLIGVTTNGLVNFAPLNDDRMIEFRVEANGYRPRTSLVTVDKSRIAEIQLEGTDFRVRGVVVATGGQPLAGARVGFTKGDDAAFLGFDVKIARNQVEPLYFHPETDRTDPQGVFTATAPPASRAIVVAHEFGCGTAPMIGWTNGSAIELRPWATLRGRMMINGRPATNRTVVAVSCSFFNSNARLYLRNIEAKTDAEGRFAFPRLPAGVIDIAHQGPGEDGMRPYTHWASFVADASLPAKEVVYDIVGRTISGTLTLGSLKRFDWRGLKIHGTLVRKVHADLDEFAPLAGGGRRAPSVFALTVNGDGDFSATAIPAGEYLVHVLCMDNFRPSAQFEGLVAVPTGEGALAMGELVVTNRTRMNQWE